MVDSTLSPSPQPPTEEVCEEVRDFATKPSSTKTASFSGFVCSVRSIKPDETTRNIEQ
jgi:hypothetical protein